MRFQTPLLMPKSKALYEGSELACFMDHSGMLVTLPYDLRVSGRKREIPLSHGVLIVQLLSLDG